MDRRRFLQTVALSAGALAAPAVVRAQRKQFEGVTLNINGFGGDYDRILRDKVARPLQEKTGLTVVYTPSTSAAAVARVIASPGNPPFDIVMCDSPSMPDLIKASVVTPTNSEATSKILPGVREFGDYGVTMSISAMVLTYNTKQVKTPLAAIADLTRPDLAGHVAMLNLENSGGVLQLLALADSNGGNVDNIDPGFAALKKLKPNLAAITSSTVNMLQLFQQEEAWAGLFYDGRVFSMKRAGKPMALVVPKEGLYAIRSYSSPVKGTKNPEAVNAYLAELVLGDFMVEMASFFGYNPPVSTQLPPEVAGKVMYANDVLKELRPINWEKVAANRGDWLTRFNREMQ
ncbi:extracellular solute-binding protein [Bradyrhizobium sp. USDA 4486]